MADLTEADIRAACVAAGLPGANIIMVRDGSIIARVEGPGVCRFVHDDGRASNGWTRRPLAQVLTEMRAAMLAEVDRALGRVERPDGANVGGVGPGANRR